MADERPVPGPWKVGEGRWSGFSRRPGHVLYRETGSDRVEIADFHKKSDAEMVAELLNCRDATQRPDSSVPEKEEDTDEG